MNILVCSSCSAYVHIDVDKIFDHNHEFIDCPRCDSLLIKSLLYGDWHESSTVIAQNEVGRKLRRDQSCPV